MIIIIILAAVREEEEHWRASSWPPFSNLPMSKKKRDPTWPFRHVTFVSSKHVVGFHKWVLQVPPGGLDVHQTCHVTGNKSCNYLSEGAANDTRFLFKKKKRIKNRKCSYCFKEQQGDLFSWWLGEKATAGIQELAASNRNRHGGGCIYLYSVKKVLLSTCSCRSDLSNLRRGGQPQSEERRKGHVTRWIKSLLANWSLSAEIFFSFH